MKRLLSSAALLVLIGAGCAEPPIPVESPAAEPATTSPTPTVAPAARPPSSAKPPAAPVAVPNAAGISPEDSEDRVVVFTADGKFEPANVAVHVGRKVTWINQSNQSVWPASNPHPIHTDCPGFDAKKVLKPGESYSFTFSKAGICSYHNHLQSGVGGQVQVTPDPKK